jgi:hypothetical protein
MDLLISVSPLSFDFDRASATVKEKEEPLPSALSSDNSPPMASTSCFAMKSPKPVPDVAVSFPGKVVSDDA